MQCAFQIKAAKGRKGRQCKRNGSFPLGHDKFCFPHHQKMVKSINDHHRSTVAKKSKPKEGALLCKQARETSNYIHALIDDIPGCAGLIGWHGKQSFTVTDADGRATEVYGSIVTALEQRRRALDLIKAFFTPQDGAVLLEVKRQMYELSQEVAR